MILGRSTSQDHSNASKERAEIFELWTYYDSEVQRIVGHEYFDAETIAFERNGFCIGNIDGDLANSVAAALANTTPRLFSASDTVPGYWTVPFDKTVVDNLNQNSTYLKLNAESRWALSEIVDAIENKVAKCLGTPFRTLNARAWYSNLGAEEFGPYGWHTDGLPNEILKIMVYLTPIDALTGGLEFMHGREIVSLPVSAPGTWVLFRNSSVRHRGIAGKERIRLVFELTLCRSVVMDTRLRTPGENAQWPKYPWIDYCEGVEPGDNVPPPPRLRDKVESGESSSL
jgi:hypothetical protein